MNWNNLVMIVVLGLLLWLAQHMPLAPLISLLLNVLLLGLLVVYVMQLLGVVMNWLPLPKLFK